MENAKMSSFIKTIYGTVFGVSFYKFLPEHFSNGLSKNDMCQQLIVFTGTEKFFYFLLFALTTIIIAHDWYFYHSDKKHENYFAYYLPQIFSLFFIAQMFVAVNESSFQYWYVFGLCYTLCNILTFFFNRKHFDKIEKRNGTIKYSIHILLATLSFYYLPAAFTLTYYLLIFCITGGVAIGIWYLEAKFKEKRIAKGTPANPTMLSDLTKISITVKNMETEIIDSLSKISAAETIAKKIQVEIEEIKNKIG